MTDAVAAAAAKHVVKKQTQSASEQCTGCCQSYPLKRSYFSAKFVPTPPNTIYSIQVSNGVKLVDWPIQEMHEFLGTQRQWGQYILRDDKLCRQIVAVFYTAYEKVIDKEMENPPNPMDLLPYAGEHRPLTIVAECDWIAPHLMNTLVGTIVEHGFVPERSAKALNALVDPMRNRRLAVQVGCVVGINLVMWLIFCIDFVHARIGDAPGAQAADGGVDGGVDGDAGGGSDQPMSNSTNSTNAADATNATIIEWEYPSETFPLFMHGVYSRRTQGLKGIPAMPFLHYHAAQLGVNSVGFVIFGAILVLKHGIFIFSTLSLFLWFFAGFGTWVIGREENHIGCSGMIYGYFAYILMIGVLKLLGCPPSCRDVLCTRDSVGDILISAAMIALYTGILYGVLPEATVVSPDGVETETVVNTWEIDLMGWLGGTLFAIVVATHLRKTRAFSKKPGHGLKAPSGKRFASAAPAGGAVGAEMGGATSSRPFPASPPADNPFGNTPASVGSESVGSDNPFLAHLPQPPHTSLPATVPPAPEPSFDENYSASAAQPTQLPPSPNPGEMSYV
ncbi:hypothetical protein KFE25_008812 [Diacronema lutheri]|uniref:Peptidase S54 rhomboid domain-containing protein n=3 Tax=Diacronema lutheri TaxID=2081491 RepID=A0A8J6CGR5_DIALT|nr:hypothetical protein KFE25_008812 [Diacronema lutheri]